MTQPENQLLFADELTIADRKFLAGLHCGDEPWSRAATEWIRGSEVIDSISRNQTKVWIYRYSDADDAIVGFSSLFATQWLSWPPPSGKRSRLLYTPQLGIDRRYRGKPDSAEFRYSNQIMEHLIGEAKKLAKQIREGKPPKKHVDLLTLRVHKDNTVAQRVYARYCFQLLPGFDDENHFAMEHKLALEDPSSDLESGD